MAEIPNTDSPQAILDGDLFAVFRAGNAQPFAQRAHDVRTPRDDSVSPDKLQTHSVTEPKIAPRAVDHNKIGSGNAPDGQVLTADGSGNASWADAGGGGGGGGAFERVVWARATLTNVDNDGYVQTDGYSLTADAPAGSAVRNVTANDFIYIANVDVVLFGRLTGQSTRAWDAVPHVAMIDAGWLGTGIRLRSSSDGPVVEQQESFGFQFYQRTVLDYTYDIRTRATEDGSHIQAHIRDRQRDQDDDDYQGSAMYGLARLGQDSTEPSPESNAVVEFYGIRFATS